MNRIPADLIYKISGFLDLEYLLILELMNVQTRTKMIGSKSAYQRILNSYDENAYNYDDISQLKKSVKIIREMMKITVVVYLRGFRNWESHEVKVKRSGTVLDLKKEMWPEYSSTPTEFPSLFGDLND